MPPFANVRWSGLSGSEPLEFDQNRSANRDYVVEDTELRSASKPFALLWTRFSGFGDGVAVTSSLHGRASPATELIPNLLRATLYFRRIEPPYVRPHGYCPDPVHRYIQARSSQT